MPLQICPEAKCRKAEMGFLGGGLVPALLRLAWVLPLTIAGLAVSVQGEALSAGTGVGACDAEAHLLTVVVSCGT